jgi:hypothetical protein
MSVLFFMAAQASNRKRKPKGKGQMSKGKSAKPFLTVTICG